MEKRRAALVEDWAFDRSVRPSFYNTQISLENSLPLTDTTEYEINFWRNGILTEAW